MRAVLINDDKSLSLREVPDPVIKDDELLIKVMASGVNRADLLQREGIIRRRRGVRSGWDLRFPERS